MNRFPVLTLVGYVLRGAAILCAILGLFAIKGAGLIGFIGIEALALSLWVFAEVSGVVLSIEDNTYESKMVLIKLANFSERGASAVPTPRTVGTNSSGEPNSRSSQSDNEIRFRSSIAAPSSTSAPPNAPIFSSSSEPLVPFQSSLAEIVIQGGSESPNSTSASYVFDRNPETYWSTTGTHAPMLAFVSFDLGSSQPVGQIAWAFASDNGSGQLRLQISIDQSNWLTLARDPDISAGGWRSTICDVSARYIRFEFRNPDGLPAIGYLREVRVFSNR